MIYQRRKGALVQMENVQSKKSLAEELGIEMDEKNFTPMVRQYLSIKEKTEIIFFCLESAISMKCFLMMQKLQVKNYNFF